MIDPQSSYNSSTVSGKSPNNFPFLSSSTNTFWPSYWTICILVSLALFSTTQTRKGRWTRSGNTLKVCGALSITKNETCFWTHCTIRRRMDNRVHCFPNRRYVICDYGRAITAVGTHACDLKTRSNSETLSSWTLRNSWGPKLIPSEKNWREKEEPNWTTNPMTKMTNRLLFWRVLTQQWTSDLQSLVYIWITIYTIEELRIYATCFFII